LPFIVLRDLYETKFSYTCDDDSIEPNPLEFSSFLWKPQWSWCWFPHSQPRTPFTVHYVETSRVTPKEAVYTYTHICSSYNDDDSTKPFDYAPSKKNPGFASPIYHLYEDTLSSQEIFFAYTYKIYAYLPKHIQSRTKLSFPVTWVSSSNLRPCSLLVGHTLLYECVSNFTSRSSIRITNWIGTTKGILACLILYS